MLRGPNALAKSNVTQTSAISQTIKKAHPTKPKADHMTCFSRLLITLHLPVAGRQPSETHQ